MKLLKAPFDFPGEVQTKARFFGREAQLHTVLEHLSGNATQPIGLQGERVSGKTSFLNVLKESLLGDDTKMWVILDMPHAQNEEAFFISLTRLIRQRYAAESQLFEEIPAGSPCSFNACLEFLVGVKLKSSTSFVILIDELDSMLQNIKCEHQRETLYQNLVDLNKLGIKTALVYTFSGYNVLANIIHSPFRDISPLPFWNEVETTGFVQFLLKDHIELADDFPPVFWEMTGGHPLLGKALLKAVSYLFQDEGCLSGSMVREACDVLFDTSSHRPPLSSVYHTIHFTLKNLQITQFDEDELKVLGVLRSGQSVTAEEHLPAAKRLAARGYLLYDGNGQYNCRIKMMYLWSHSGL